MTNEDLIREHQDIDREVFGTTSLNDDGSVIENDEITLFNKKIIISLLKRKEDGLYLLNKITVQGDGEENSYECNLLLESSNIDTVITIVINYLNQYNYTRKISNTLIQIELF